MGRPAIDIRGQIFSRWTVLERDGSDPRKIALWRCRCVCGKERSVTGVNLRRGRTRSCGCLREERCREISGRGFNPHRVVGDTVEIDLLRRDGSVAATTVIDLEDLPLVQDRRWHLGGEYVITSGTWTAGKGRTTLYLHRVLFAPLPPGRQVDHISGDRLDNRRCNLRLVTGQENHWNTTKTWSASGFKGVYRSKNRWSAAIRKDDRLRYLGTWETPEEAAIAYDNAAEDLFGEYAATNERIGAL